jgi:IS30 family transposase
MFYSQAPVILPTQEVEIRRIAVRSQLGQIVRETLSQKFLPQKIGLVEVAQGEGSEFKPSTKIIYIYIYMFYRESNPGRQK